MIRLNLGCGMERLAGYVNVDNREEMQPDLCVDVTAGLPYQDNTVDEVRAYDFLEHIPIGKAVPLIEEIFRVLKPGGTFEHFTPSTDGRGAFQDPFHVSFWNINTWHYYTIDAMRAHYGIKARFITEKLVDIRTGIGVIHTHGIMIAHKPTEQTEL